MMPPMNVGPTATKKNVLEQLLDQGMVLVALDARIDGVEVPSHLGRDAQLRLNLSYRFGLPMTVDEWGILATLTFAGVPFNCRFPWRSVFLLVSHVSGQPYLFPDDIPPELLSQATAEAGIDAKIFTSADTHAAPAARPKLRLVKADQAEDEAASDGHDGEDEGDDAGEDHPSTQPKFDFAEDPEDDHDDEEAGDTDDARVPRAAKTRQPNPLRFAKRKDSPEVTESGETESVGKPDDAPPGPRVAPALKRRSGRGLRSGAAARTSNASEEVGPSASGPQKVSQPTRVSLSSASNKPGTQDNTESPSAKDSNDDKPDDTPPGGRPRKGGHLRVVK